MSERDYWTKLRGEDYNAMFAGKYEDVHAAQERWLRARVRHLSDRIAPPFPNILEVGCGPGRLAVALDGLCMYSGYDQSDEMTQPLRHMIDSGQLPFSDVVAWIRKTSRYAAAFTCSALIHNPPAVVRGLIAEMCVVAPFVWLIENKAHQGESHKVSGEHGGCWVHDYAQMVPPGWRCTVQDLCRTHDVYMLEQS